MEVSEHITAAILAAHRAIACERAAQTEPERAGLWMEIAASEHAKTARALARFERCPVAAGQALNGSADG